MKHTILILIAASLALCGCVTDSTGKRTFNPAAWTKAHQPQINATLASVAQTAARDAEQIVLSAAVSYADGQTKGNIVDGLAYGLRTNETSLLTANDVRNIVTIWTPASDGPQHWEQLASTIADTYAKAQPKTQAESAAVLEAIANGLNTAVASDKTP